MGKGDRKTKRGKRFMGSYGKRRKRKGSGSDFSGDINQSSSNAKPEKMKGDEKKTATKSATKKKASPKKKTVAKKAAEKK